MKQQSWSKVYESFCDEITVWTYLPIIAEGREPKSFKRWVSFCFCYSAIYWVKFIKTCGFLTFRLMGASFEGFTAFVLIPGWNSRSGMRHFLRIQSTSDDRVLDFSYVFERSASFSVFRQCLEVGGAGSQGVGAVGVLPCPLPRLPVGCNHCPLYWWFFTLVACWTYPESN